MEKITLKQVSYAHLQKYKEHFVGWEYPKQDLSPFIRYLDNAQRAAINAWGWFAILLFVLSPILAWYFANYWWLVGLPLSFVVWRSNRKSMEQFFLENWRPTKISLNLFRDRILGSKLDSFGNDQ